MAVHAYLDLPDGMSMRVGPAGVLIGRHRSCDILLANETASRRHALLRVAPDGVELIVLGKHAVHVDGRATAPIEIVPDGARVEFPGFTCRVRLDHADDHVRVDYALVRGSERFPIRTSPFVIGGDTADVVVAGWPDAAVRLQLAQDVLYLEIDGADPVVLTAGDTFTVREQTFAIARVHGDDASTVVPQPNLRAVAVVLEPLPRGGRVTWQFADGPRSVYIPGRRFRLVHALAAPPAPYAIGDYIPDSELVPIVWADNDEVGGRTDINVLLTRCRQDLVAAGLAATALIERAPGGRATRLVVATPCEVEVKSP
ncbi:MAG TPA: FHA domain-containing protein [Kofleriaceae bacterium]|jgi:hypothetical protein|nr:FHA domain-containing protein [Kofleriaceae bacterium]